MAVMTDIIQNAATTTESYQSIVTTVSIALFYFPTLIGGAFLLQIPNYVYLILSFLPSFPMMNMFNSTFIIGFLNPN